LKGEGFERFGVIGLRDGPPDQFKGVRSNGDLVALPIEENAVPGGFLSGGVLSGDFLSAGLIIF
jgi:hypothetical protein